MAYKDFVVRNGLVVNTNFVTNSTAIYFGNSTSNATVNSTALKLGNSSLNSTLNTTALSVSTATFGNTTITATVNSSGIYYGNSSVNLYSNSTYLRLTSNIVINSTAIAVGSGSTNAWLTTSGLYLNGSEFPSGGGYYKGNNGAIGNTNNRGNLFRINSNTMTTNVTISAGENALTTGPIVVNTGVTFAIETGGRAVIV